MTTSSREEHDYYPEKQSLKFAAYDQSSTKPYLGPKARLSQVWINRWTILILLVLARMLLALRDLNSDLAAARREALSACTSVESMGSAMASMPYYMSAGVNELTAKSIEKAVHGLHQMAMMSLTGVEEIVIFVINILTSTYLCLISLVVGGALHAAVSLLEDVAKWLSAAAGSIGKDLGKVVQDFDKALNGVISGLNTVGSLFGGKPIPKINVDKTVEKLNSLTIDTTEFTKDLEDLNKKIPNFTQVQNMADDAIRIPFKEIKKLANKSMGVYKFDRSVFKTPPKEKISFCTDNNGITDFFDKIFLMMVTAKKIFLIVLAVAAVAVCIPMGYREVWRWRSQKQRAELVNCGKHDPLDVVYIVSRPYTSRFGLWISSKLQSLRRKNLVRWVVAYATTEAALFVLALGLAGLFTCACHAVLMKSIERVVPELADQVGDFAAVVINKLNNASQQWSVETNRVITKTNSDINRDMLGWVNTSVDAIEKVLYTFTNETTKALNATFGGTVLREPIQGLFDCMIGLKIVGVEKALNWIEDNAHVSFPLLPNDTFSLGAATRLASSKENASQADQAFLANPGDAAGDKISGAIIRVVNKLWDAIVMEVFISLVILGIWFIIVLIGIIMACFRWFGHDTDEPADADYHTSEKIDNNGSAQLDFRSNDQDRFHRTESFDMSHPANGHDSFVAAADDDPFADDKAIERHRAAMHAAAQGNMVVTPRSARATYRPDDKL